MNYPKTIAIVVLLLLVLTQKNYAQTGALYPELAAGYQVIMSGTNPSYIPNNGIYNITGLAKFKSTDPNVAVYHADASYAISGDGVFTKSLVRIHFYNEKEGPYISNSRAYLHYAVQKKLASEVQASLGISGGFVSRMYTASSSTGAGSLFLPDAALGGELKLRKYSVGIIAAQLLNQSGKPLEASVSLNSYYQAYIHGRQEISEKWELKEQFFYRLLTDNNNQFIAGVGTAYDNNVSCSILYFSKRGITFSGGLKFDQFDVSIAYNSPLFSSVPIWNDSFEMGVHYFF